MLCDLSASLKDQIVKSVLEIRHFDLVVLLEIIIKILSRAAAYNNGHIAIVWQSARTTNEQYIKLKWVLFLTPTYSPVTVHTIEIKKKGKQEAFAL